MNTDLSNPFPFPNSSGGRDPLKNFSPRRLSHQLREQKNPDLTRRRWILGLSFVGATLGKIVGLYQMGIIRRVPDPPFQVFDSTRVNASDYGYKRAQTPDALLMVASYAVTAILA